MFRIETDEREIRYRTDLYSRCQIGAGGHDPEGKQYSGSYKDIDGTVSCSVVVDADTVTRIPKEAEWPGEGDEHLFIPQQEFWRDEFKPNRPLPTKIEELTIYELHVASLGAERQGPNGDLQPGTFNDAINLLDEHLVPLGVNAVELLPVAEFGGHNEWGYGDTHYFALEFRSGGRDQFKHFVRACHQRGIAVILDVVYNHFSPHAERAENRYDTEDLEKNIYYWYEGRTSDYADGNGGYVDNGSTGWAPRYWEENVRKLFISSAAALLTEFHVDGFRVDLTQAIHRDNVLHANGSGVASANVFGAKLLREWARTLKMIRPFVFLIAEDHTGWDKVTQSPDEGGLGFDATWYADFYHNLVGVPRDDWASLVSRAGLGGDGSLAMDALARSLSWTGQHKVVYHMSHDEAGNSGKEDSDPDKRSHRTLVQAIHGGANLIKSRTWAEARSRFALGMSLLSAGTPMFLMGEEVGFINDYTWNDYLRRREDLNTKRQGEGARLFRFYQDLIAFRKDHRSVRGRQLVVLHASCDNRVLVFRRNHDEEDLLVFASLNNQPFSSGYWIYTSSVQDAAWKEVFNSDAAIYGGNNIGNSGGIITTRGGYMGPVVPQNGFVVFQRI
jgi:1,4-alpha-glucan branching enzyme